MDRSVVQTDVDRYIIVEYIAEGGMGAIFRGKKVGMVGFEKEVVLKQLLPEFTSQPEFIDLFLREAKLSAALDHANIVHTIDLVAAHQDYFIVMEYIRGGDLRNIQRRIKQLAGRLQPAAALFIARETLSALAYAHEKCNTDGQPLKLIHRDVSPSNIMISASGEVKLADFGIAKASTHKSVFYRVKGKIGYMSPEQARGDSLDLRSDLYSLAVCLHEMLSSERLFIADMMSTAEQIYNQPIKRLEGLLDIPRGVDAVLAKALAKNPEERYQTAHEFQDALVQLSYDSGIVFTAPDLADHLKQVCGPDPSAWNKEITEEQQAQGGTQVLAEEISQLSKVELTSVFTPPAEDLGPDDVDEDEATRHIRLDRYNIAFDPTRIQQPPFDPARLRGQTGGQNAGAAGAGQAGWDSSSQSLRVHEPSRTMAVHGEIYLPGDPRWDDDRQSPRTAQLDHASSPRAATPRPATPRPATPRPATPRPTTPRPITPRPITPRPITPRPITPRPHRPLAPPHLEQAAPREGDKELEAAPAAARFALPRGARSGPYSRRGMIAASLVLLLVSGIIVLVIGLTGPDLETETTPGLLGVDLGGTPDLQAARAAARGLAAQATKTSAATSLSPDSSAPGPTRKPEQEEERGALGRLKVISTPPDATVYLDGSRQCQSPCIIEELQRNQVFLLSVRRAGYISWSSLVELGKERALAITVYLQEEPASKSVGFLLIRSRPRADVLIDGKEIGRVTSEGRIPLRPGRYEVMLSHPRKRRRPRYTVTVKPGKLITLRSRL